MPTPPPTPTLDAACDLIFTHEAPALAGLVVDGHRWCLEEGPAFVLPEDLIGLVAPFHWDGIAVVTTGTAHHVDGSHASMRARVTYALDRAGREAATITTADATSRITGGGAVGHLADVCHRLLGLPAAPEPTTPATFVASVWLSDVLAAHDDLGDGFPADDWAGVADLCPFGPTPANGFSWADLHAVLVSAGQGWDHLSASDVAWTDPPTLARFILAGLPPLMLLLAELATWASPDVVRQVLCTLAERGVDLDQLSLDTAGSSAP